MNEEALANWGLSRQKQTAERKTFNRTNRTRDFPCHMVAAVIRVQPSDLRQKKGTDAGTHEDKTSRLAQAIQILNKHYKDTNWNRFSFNMIHSHLPLR
jgi:hypothetical protein